MPDIPTSLTGKEFEEHVIKGFERVPKIEADLKRYGVQAVFSRVACDRCRTPVVSWRKLRSLPDFDLAVRGGRQVVFDAKVCSQASMQLQGSTVERQLTHMLDRSQLGVPCFYLIHWAERILKTKSFEAETWTLPVHPSHPFWIRAASMERRVVTRDDCYEYGIQVEWTAPGRSKIPRPDVLAAVMQMFEHAPAPW